MSDIYAKIPQPLSSIGCQDLLKQPISHCGWVRKRHLASKLKLFRWPQVYMVVSTGCVYYFRNEYCKSPAGKFSLFGFNSVTRAQDVKSKEALYPFKIDHTHKDEFKSYYFACSSEVEMKDWMKVIKEELKLANNAEKRDGDYYYTQGFSPSKARTEQTPDAQGFSNDSGFGPSGDGDTASISYKDIEESIYDDPYQFKPPQDYGLYAKKADEASDDEDIPDNPPPVPPRGACTPSTEGKKKKKRRKHKKDSSGELPDVSKVSVSKSESAAKEMAAAVTKEMEGHFEKKNARGTDSSKRKPSNASQSSVEDDSRKMSLVSDPGGDDIDEEEEDDPDNYWNKIYYEGDKDLASELIRDMGENGVYLVRGGGGGDGQVLVVFAENMPKKYKIQSKDGKFFIAQAGPHEDSLEELLYEYYGTDLPNTSVKLSTPFQLHPKYDT